jgi:hypothetical protein
MAKSKTTMRRKAKSHRKTEPKYPDAALIRLCCNLLAAIGAYRGCGEGDPDGNNVHAEPLWTQQCKRVDTLITQAAAKKATTLAGLVSKAVATVAIMDYEAGCHLTERDEAFIAAFAREVDDICREVIQVEEALKLGHQYERERANKALAS